MKLSVSSAWRLLRHNRWLPVLARALGYLGLAAALAVVGAGGVERLLEDGHPPAVPALAMAAGHLAATPSPVAAPSLPPAAPSASASRATNTCGDGHGGALTADGKVILNRAGVEALKRLPGVGERRAKAILAVRSKLGRFRGFRDLMRVRGIGYRSLKRIRAHAVIDAPTKDR